MNIRKKLLILISLFVALLGRSQKILEPAILECHYTHIMQKDTLYHSKIETDSMILRIGDTTSQFFSWHTFYHDSLWADPVGRTIAENLSLEAFRTRDLNLRLRSRTTRDYIYKNFPTGKISVMSKDFYIGYAYEEECQHQHWLIQDSVKNIAGYDCQLAVCEFRGRTYSAWFAKEIPYCNGPWKLGGLPGLILEAYDKEKHYYYMICHIKQNDITPVTVYNFDGVDYLKTNRNDYLNTVKNYLSGTPVEELELIHDVIWNGKKQSFFPKEKRRLLYDFLERDYNNKENI